MKRQTIMAVDDSKMELHIVSSSIESIGYKPVTANHGGAAIELLEQVGDEVALIIHLTKPFSNQDLVRRMLECLGLGG